MMRLNGQKFDTFEQGQKVWVEGTNLHIGYPSKKLSPKREGPFKISKVLGPITYQLDLPKQWKVHNVFHAGLLSPYKETEAHGPSFTEPPPDLINDIKEYEVEAIIRHKLKKGFVKSFLVSWTGYDSSHNEWRSLEELEHAEEKVQEYIKAHKLKLKPHQSST
ncbi:hypothetical protein MPER_13264 [Moniliophthora perniciosa FA553]|nr:hypothetical protein MPER_13264 [Moniliophthora perniciosa FA553]